MKKRMKKVATLCLAGVTAMSTVPYKCRFHQRNVQIQPDNIC